MLKVLFWLVAIVAYSVVLVGNADPIKREIADASANMNVPAVTDTLDSMGLLPGSPPPLEDLKESST